MTGEKIKQKLSELGKTPGELAKLLKMTEQEIFSSPDFQSSTVEKICKVLDVPITFLYGKGTSKGTTGRTLKIIEEQLREKFGFKLINTDEFKPLFYHYYTLDRFAEMFTNDEIAFVYPALWNDPAETMFLNTDYTKLDGYNQKKIYCLCLRNSKDSEEASWKVYSNGDDTLIRVGFKIDFFSSIKEFAEKNKCVLYISKMEYKLTDEIVDCFHKNVDRNQRNNKLSDFLEGYLKRKGKKFNEENYIQLMSLKRPAFAYEEEYRFFIVPQADSTLDTTKDVIKVPINKDVYDNFLISPMERIPDDKKEYLSYIIKRKLYNQKVQHIKKIMWEIMPSAKIANSTLYEDLSRIQKISYKTKSK